MACVICAEITRLAKIAREKLFAHQDRLAALRRGENPNAKAANDPEQTPVAAPKAGKATGDQQAGDPGTAHGKQGLAKPATSRAAAGQSSVPKVRKARGRA